MKLFSERYNYTKASDVIIRERITPEIQNAICSCYDRLSQELDYIQSRNMEQYLWAYFLNNRLGNYDRDIVSTSYIENQKNPWYKKIDLVEFTIKYLNSCCIKYRSNRYYQALDEFVTQLNYEFKRLNFGYRVVGTEIVEITSEEEIKTIESATHDSPNNIRAHLNKALELYAQRPIGDYRNSIKESISAVEAYCREKTGKNTLGEALNEFKKTGIAFPPILIDAFIKLYAYTNQPDTGIRHALMDNDTDYEPGAEEALFMLVSCSSFINYLNKKIK